jgi:hypothetical protein
MPSRQNGLGLPPCSVQSPPFGARSDGHHHTFCKRVHAGRADRVSRPQPCCRYRSVLDRPGRDARLSRLALGDAAHERIRRAPAAPENPAARSGAFAYEAAERANVAGSVLPAQLSPELKLDHFKYVFMVDDEAVLFGVRPPSTKLRPIPRDELSELYPVTGLSQLNYRTPYDRVAYVAVKVRTKDLRRIARDYPKEAAKFIAQLKRSELGTAV